MELLEKNLTVICKAVRSIRIDEFEKLKKDCLQTLKEGNKLIATGLGKNVPICEKFIGSLNSLGVCAAFMHTNSALHGDLGMVKNRDLVIVLTKSGETEESIQLVRHLKQRNCKIWLLSFNRGSTLYCQISNRLIIELEHEGDKWNILPNNSSILNLIVLQELAMQLINEENLGIEILRLNHPDGAIGTKLRT